MRRLGPLRSSAAAILLACLAGASGAQERAVVARLSWLAGCWESVRGDRHVEEQWMAPRGGTMLGVSRTVTGGRTRGYEQMRIEERDGRLVFTSKPSGQPEASFSSIELTDSSVVFENPSHDFPQRVLYRRKGDGSLFARIEGVQAGKTAGVDFPMARSACGPGAGR